MVLLFLNVGFVRSPFAHWTRGKITTIDIARDSLSVQTGGGPAQTFYWTKDTRYWIEPTGRRDRGALFDPRNLNIGADVRLLSSKTSSSNRLTRIIRIASK